MKRLSLHLAVACLTLCAGIAAGNAASFFPRGPISRRSSDRVSPMPEGDRIREAVFRHQMRSYDSGGRRMTFFLSCGDDADPSEEVMGRLEAGDLPVKKLTDIRLYGEKLFPHSDTHYLIVRVSNIQRIGGDKAIVGGSFRGWGHRVEAYLYYVTRRGDQWVVERSELIT